MVSAKIQTNCCNYWTVHDSWVIFLADNLSNFTCLSVLTAQNHVFLSSNYLNTACKTFSFAFLVFVGFRNPDSIVIFFFKTHLSHLLLGLLCVVAPSTSTTYCSHYKSSTTYATPCSVYQST